MIWNSGLTSYLIRVLRAIRCWRIFFGQVALDALSLDEEPPHRALVPNRVQVTPFLEENLLVGYILGSYVDFDGGSWHAGHHQLVLDEIANPYDTIGAYLALAETGDRVGDLLGPESPELKSLVMLAATCLYERDYLSSS